MLRLASFFAEHPFYFECYSTTKVIILSQSHPTPLVDELFAQIRQQLQALADPTREAGVRHYFNEPVNTYGLYSAQITAVVRPLVARLKRDGGLDDALALAERLLQTDGLEEGGAAQLVLSPYQRRLTPEHFPLLDRWVDYFSNWAVTDGICTHTIGGLVEAHPVLADHLPPWTESSNRWRRRVACVTLAPAARHGRIGPDPVFAVTRKVMDDRDDMVQKGAGWVLRELTARYQDEVLEYLRGYPQAGRILVRYALEKTPQERRQEFVKPLARS